MHHPNLPFFPPLSARTHEVCGSGAYAFAFILAARLSGQCIWIREAWNSNQINPNGFSKFIDPSVLMFCNTKDQVQSLAVAEETLRSGAVPLVVTSLSKPLGLTEGRRLNLAARDGKSTGLAIILDGMGSNVAETRWRCTPIFDPKFVAQDSTLQKWELIKNKAGTLGAWHVQWNSTSRRLIMVSPSRK